MTRAHWAALGFAALIVAVATACSSADAGASAKPAARTLRPFASEAELKSTLDRLRAQMEKRRRTRVALPQAVMEAPAPPPPAASPGLDKVVVTGTRVQRADVESAQPVTSLEKAQAEGEESITNVQTAGVDEGDIVKRRGDHLVVLRRGRLFTIRIGGDMLKPISSIDAYGPDIDPRGTWYDEMLASGRTVVVIGYSYDRGGTEIGLFDLDDSGGLKYRATYHLRSNDYYSSRNYASRLIGDKLVFYSPMFFNYYSGDYSASMPALRRWHRGADAGGFKRILSAKRIYRGAGSLDPDAGLALHTVTVCGLEAPEMRCEATAVLGPPGHVFYVSEDSAFVWTASWQAPWGDAAPKRNGSDVFRIPLDGSAPTAMRATGAPIDQMSFLQKDGYLNVLVGATAGGQWMWSAQAKAGDLALMRVPLSMFGDGTQSARGRHYRPLHGDTGNGAVQNRYVGDWLIVGAGRSWNGEALSDNAHAIRYASSEGFVDVPVGHAVERIEALGDDALVVGNAGADLHFTSLRLGARPERAGNYVLAQASQGEERTHGFFYRPTGEGMGVIGLPVLQGARDGTAGASVLFLRNRDLRLGDMGRLDARAGAPPEDDCKASCVDWYGNARPIFIGRRVFALLGYELVEGSDDGQRIRERRRVDFSPVLRVTR